MSLAGLVPCPDLHGLSSSGLAIVAPAGGTEPCVTALGLLVQLVDLLHYIIALFLYILFSHLSQVRART